MIKTKNSKTVNEWIDVVTSQDEQYSRSLLLLSIITFTHNNMGSSKNEVNDTSSGCDMREWTPAKKVKI